MPSRGRPDRAFLAAEAALTLATRATTEVWIAVDADDPTLDAYRLHRRGALRLRGLRVVVLGAETTGNLVKATNHVSMDLADSDPDCIIGNLGDDHVVRTKGWDDAIVNVLKRPGIAYGNDLLQGERLPTAPFISARIVNALGWYALPSCRHMYIDDAWKAIGRELGVLRYLPDLVIEHVHPATGAVPTDEGYARADESTMDDAKAYFRWRNTTFYQDVANVRRVL